MSRVLLEFRTARSTRATGLRGGVQVVADRLVEKPYVDTIILRWQGFSGGTAVLDGDGRSYDEIAAGRVAQVAEEWSPRSGECALDESSQGHPLIGGCQSTLQRTPR